ETHLKRGYVAYLTQPGFETPAGLEWSRKFLGHFFWPEVYSIIKRVNSRNAIHKQFLEYLEARHMGPSKITQNELRAAAHAVDFFRKTRGLVGKVRDKIGPSWEKQFGGKNAGAKRVSPGLGEDGDFPYWWYRPKKWNKKGKRFY